MSAPIVRRLAANCESQYGPLGRSGGAVIRLDSRSDVVKAVAVACATFAARSPGLGSLLITDFNVPTGAASARSSNPGTVATSLRRPHRLTGAEPVPA